MNTVQSKDGTGIAYTKAGDGPPVILVDGTACYRKFGPSTRLAKRLTGRFNVVTYDRRGRGDSGDVQPYVAEREIEDLQLLIDHAGGPTHLFGVSSRAALALETAARGAGVSKLVPDEAPFTDDASHAAAASEYSALLTQLLAAGRRGNAVQLFLRRAGVPGALITLMRISPIWSKLTAIAPRSPTTMQSSALSRRASRCPPSGGPRSPAPCYARSAATVPPGRATVCGHLHTPCPTPNTGRLTADPRGQAQRARSPAGEVLHQPRPSGRCPPDRGAASRLTRPPPQARRRRHPLPLITRPGSGVWAPDPRRPLMLIIAGKLYVHPQERDRWVAAHKEITRIARSQPGCLDLHLSADPLEEGRINLFEQWESEAALQAWRAAAEAPPNPQILGANIHKHHICSSGPPF
jgi:quinol monooxygenase YgiN